MLAVHQQLLGLANIKLQVIVVAQCDKVLYQSSTLLLILFVNASNNGAVVGKLLKVAGT